MNLETLFEKFDLFADAPDAVAKMRELVLELAIRGKLVAQDAADEPAAVLVRKIQAEKSRRKGPIDSLDREPDLNDNDLDFVIPTSWEWVGTMTPVLMVSDQGKKVLTKDILATGRYPVIDQGKVFIRGYCDDPGKVIHVAEPIVLFGDHTRETKLIDFDFVVGADGVKLLQPVCIEPKYYFLTLRWLPLESRGYARHFKLLRAARIPLPPLAEQKRIVAKVDELMALCDRLESQQKERETRHAALARASLARFADAPTAANLNFIFHKSYDISPADLRKTILTLAVQGKLVPQDPKDEPASKVLASGAELPDGHIRRRKIVKRAPISSKSELFPDLPPSWEYASVQSLYDLNLIVDYADGNHGSLYPRSSEFGDAGVMFVTARDIADGRVSWNSCAQLNEERANQLTKGWSKGGDVLLTHNATVGRVARVEQEVGKFLLGTSVTFYRLNEEFIHPSYFYHVLCSPTWQGQLEAIMEQTTRNQVSIQKQAFFQVPLPPVAEQRRIVAKLDELMALVGALETQLATARTAAEKLMEAVVAELTEAERAMRTPPQPCFDHDITPMLND